MEKCKATFTFALSSEFMSFLLRNLKGSTQVFFYRILTQIGAVMHGGRCVHGALCIVHAASFSNHSTEEMQSSLYKHFPLNL